MKTKQLIVVLFPVCLLATIIASAQQSASVDGPSFVKAGESVTITVNIDRPPNFEGGSLRISLSPEGPSRLGGFAQGVAVHANQTRYTAVFSIPPTMPG